MICVLPATGQDADGFTIFYYESGQKSSEGFLINGKPDGFWKTYHENGIIKSEGNRVNFMLDSIWNFYNDTGKVVMQITYGMGKKNGIRRTFHEDEVIEENFVDDVKQGFTYYYYPNGKLKEEVYFEEGLEEGTGRQYALSDGRVIKLKYYKKGFVYDIENINRMDKAGLRQGPWKYFYENGNVRVEGEYKNGLEHGYFKEYTEDGNLISTSKFVDGILQEDVSELAKLDIKREYYPDGKVKIMASFKDGVAEGVRREYSEEGDIIKGFVFIKGNVVGEGITNDEGFRDGPWKEYYFSGALKAEGMYDKGKRSGEWKFYHPNGEIEQTGKYNKEGKEDGTWTWYYPEGLLQREETYFNGMRDGYSVEYDENGIVVAEGEYIEDSREGFWKLNYGDHREEGAYFNDMRSGEWKHFYNEGTLSFEGNFIDDNPNGKHTWYWPSGFKKTEGTYIMGLKTGEWVKYNADGTPFITFYYENGAESKVDGVKFNIFDEDK
ncbi:MAG: toxin-antitoxin system YwqK family antitoxin [Bacteroidales bacterium]|nr:toxin-antitoxin system YwqK family antitoxin [Bacteroidales bacterium]